MNQFYLPGLCQLITTLSQYGGPTKSDIALHFHLSVPEMHAILEPVTNPTVRVAGFSGLVRDIAQYFCCSVSELGRGFTADGLITIQVSYLRRIAAELDQKQMEAAR